MSDDQNRNSDDLRPKPMKGKYDGRKNNGATKARRRVFSNVGRKPNWAKHLSRNEAVTTLREFDDIASPADIYRAAWEKGNLGLCVELYKQFHDRLHGKPFTAENPEKVAKAETLAQDTRLRDAIKQLVPSRGAAKSKTVM
jgi:hypothetical protein